MLWQTSEDSLSCSGRGALHMSNKHGARGRVSLTCCGGEDCGAAQRQSASALQAPLEGAQPEDTLTCGR